MSMALPAGAQAAVAKPLPTVQFYIPFRADGVARLPAKADEYWQWLLAHPKVGEGKYAWTLQTYLWLKDSGLPCRVVEDLPDSGIVISHRDFLPVFLRPRAGVFLICTKADRNMHSWSQFHVVQNERDPLRLTRNGARASASMLHWPQPGLLPRDSRREARCENVAYFGRKMNLAAELRDPQWTAGLQRQGFRWLTPERPVWHDYREIDVTVSVRNFSEKPESDSPVLNVDSKPASKLVNSWMAGVPAIVGREPAYRQVRRSPLDFVEVASAEELRQALVRLRDQPALYRHMVENGLTRAREFSPAAITTEWVNLFREGIAREYAGWSGQSTLRRSWTGYWRCASYFCKPQHLRSILGALGR